MKTLRIDYCDFWNYLDKNDNYLTRLLRRRYDVRICDQPDFVICANYGYHHRLYTCPRIYFTGEPSSAPDFRRYDYALTWRYIDDPRHFRLPFYPFYFDGELLVKSPGEPESLLAEKTKFCAFVVGNRRATRRIEFFQKLNRLKPVDSAGRYLNNIGRSIGGTPEDKLAFLRPYKFNIAFENQSLPGYTTEKIAEAMRARCVPVYWGNPRIAEDFNPASFLNYHEFPNEEALLERMLELDQNDELYLEMLRQPFFHGNQVSEAYRGDKLLDFFEKIFSTKITPVGSRRSWFQVGRWIPVKKNRAFDPLT